MVNGVPGGKGLLLGVTVRVVVVGMVCAWLGIVNNKNATAQTSAEGPENERKVLDIFIVISLSIG
jgi:hypothetical protein